MFKIHVFHSRYNEKTGMFTVPSGGDGLYFFSAHLVVNDKKWGHFTLRKNTDEILCGFLEDNRNSVNEDGTGSCSTTTLLTAGKKRVVHC